MQELKERIINDGQVIGTEVLKVDSFLNHQIDPSFIMRMGQELASRFKDTGVTKVLTVEASGIAVAMAVALVFGVPVVFAKKKPPVTQGSEVFSADVFSFTKQETVKITVTKTYLKASDTILIVDDFLAHGEALRGLVSIVHAAGARLAGAGIVIEKCFQHGGDRLREQGLKIESLAAIEQMHAGLIEFRR